MLWKLKDEPIIDSLTDVDMYKFTMGQLIYLKHPKVPVKSGFINRTKTVNLTKHISKEQLKEQLDHARTLRFTNSELHYLRGTNEYGDRMFQEPYLRFLKDYQLPEYDLEYYRGKLLLHFPGEWAQVSHWETIALSIVSELFSISQVKKLSQIERDAKLAIGIQRLHEKIKELKMYPDLTFSDFGTRRRAFKFWQHYVVATLQNELPKQFLGTSNVQIAMNQSLLPMGTSAHELYMVYSCLFGDSDENIRSSVQEVIKDWWELYGWGLSVHLPDTFGTKAFLEDLSLEDAARSKGMRQDSANPITFGERLLRFYKEKNIQAKDKLIVFSDSLNVKKMIQLFLHFENRIRTTNGWD